MTEEFLKKLERKTRRVDEMLAAHGYDAVMILAQAMVRGNSTEAEVIDKQLSTTSFYNTASGRIKFPPRGGVIKPVTIQKWTGDAFELVKVHRNVMEITDR